MCLKEILGHPKAFHYEVKYVINLKIKMKSNHWGLSEARRLRGLAKRKLLPPVSLTPASHLERNQDFFPQKYLEENPKERLKLKREIKCDISLPSRK